MFLFSCQNIWPRNTTGFVESYLQTGQRKIIGTSRKVTGQRRDKSTFSLWLTVSEQRHGAEYAFIGTLHEANPSYVLDDDTEVDTESDTLSDCEATSQAYRVMENLSEATLITNSQGKIFYANKAALAFLEFKHDELVGHNVKTILPSVCLAQEANAKDWVSKGGQRFVGKEWDAVLQTKLGTLVAVTVSMSSEQHKDGKQAFVAIIRQRKETEECISNKSELQQEREVIDNLAHFLVLLSEKIEAFKALTTQHARFLDILMVDVLGQNVKMIVPPGVHQDNHDMYVAKYIQTGKGSIIGTAGRSVEALAKDGRRVPMFLSVTDRKTGDGKHIFTAILHPQKQD